MNIGVADDHAKQRLGLYQNGGDLGGERDNTGYGPCRDGLIDWVRECGEFAAGARRHAV
jgi:hypothetical protein